MWVNQLTILILLTSLSLTAFSQHLVPREDDRAKRFIERHYIKNSSELVFHPSVNPFPTEYLKEALATQLNGDSTSSNFEEASWLLPSYFQILHSDPDRLHQILSGQIKDLNPRTENPILSEKPILRYFYRSPANLYERHSKEFSFQIRPVLRLEGGPIQDDSWYFYNRRGVVLQGNIDQKVFFYSSIYETQARWHNHLREYITNNRAVPGEGYFKGFDSRILNLDQANDFLNASSYVAFKASPHIDISMGYGRNTFGEGIRSLLLSDFANNYFYLRADTRVWKLHYTNLFAELATTSHREVRGEGLIPKKYMASHYLSISLFDNLQLGLYESIIYSRDSGLELQYLNPIIFYRVVEQGLGSPDNALLGLHISYQPWKRLNIYGQLVIDEFRFNELFGERRGWWGNKYGFQIGLQYPDAFSLPQLDLQAEFNTVRPYTYTHSDSSGSYTHFNQELAHPLGANFREFIGKINYQIGSKWLFELTLMYAVFGEGRLGENYGKNVRLSNLDRIMEFGNETTQGYGATTTYLHFTVSRELAYNFYLDVFGMYRHKESELEMNNLITKHFGAGFRWNINPYRPVF